MLDHYFVSLLGGGVLSPRSSDIRAWAVLGRRRLLLFVTVVAVTCAVGIAVRSPAYADYAADCASPTQVFPDAGGMPGNLNLTAADVVLFASGMFGGSVNSSGGTICVAVGAAFNPANFNGASRLFVRGTALLPAIAAGSGALLDNEGTVTFAAQPNTNGIATVLNRSGATIVVQGAGVALGPAVTVVNDGTIDVVGGVNLNGSTVTNNGTLTVGGAFNVVGTLTNTAQATIGGQLTINGGGALVNSCSLTTAGLIANAGVTNDGVIELDANSLLINGSATYTQSAAAITAGANFTNNGSVNGTGQYLFTGTTSTQGTFAGTAPATPIVFFDTTPTGAQIFDVESGSITNTVRQPVVRPPAGACNTSPVPPPTTTTTTTTTSSTTSTTAAMSSTSSSSSSSTVAPSSSSSAAPITTATTGLSTSDPAIVPTSQVNLPPTGPGSSRWALALGFLVFTAGCAALAMSRRAHDGC